MRDEHFVFKGVTRKDSLMVEMFDWDAPDKNNPGDANGASPCLLVEALPPAAMPCIHACQHTQIHTTHTHTHIHTYIHTHTYAHAYAHTDDFMGAFQVSGLSRVQLVASCPPLCALRRRHEPLTPESRATDS